MLWISGILALAIVAVIVGGLLSRGDKGIGWQFIRFTVLGISIPTIGLLALNNALTGEAAALIGAANGLRFCQGKR